MLGLRLAFFRNDQEKYCRNSEVISYKFKLLTPFKKSVIFVTSAFALDLSVELVSVKKNWQRRCK